MIILPLEPRTFINPNSVRESGGTADVAHSVLTVFIRCRVNLILGCFQHQTFRVSLMGTRFSVLSLAAATSFNFVFAPTNEPRMRGNAFAHAVSAPEACGACHWLMYVPPL